MPFILSPQMPDLPADLQRSGWTHSLRDSQELGYLSGTIYKVVYARDFDPARDDRAMVNLRRNGRIVVSTRARSWDEAYQRAIDDMRYIDRARIAS